MKSPLALCCAAGVLVFAGCDAGDVTGSKAGSDAGSQGGSADAQIGDGPYAAERAFCLNETNRYRATQGRAPLEHSQALEDFAEDSARINHQANSPHKHFADTLGGGVACAENEIPRWSIAQSGSVRGVVEGGLALMWSEGPGGGHYETILGPYQALGCGIYVEGNSVTVVQDYGNLDRSCPPP